MVADLLLCGHSGDIMDLIFGAGPGAIAHANNMTPVIGMGDLDPFAPHAAHGINQSVISAPARVNFVNGDKYPGSFGITQLQIIDYWTLRARSAQLFNTNLYARGIIRRLITNEINTGLQFECIPVSELVGMGEEELQDWSEGVEDRFMLWGSDPMVCDYEQAHNFGAIQRAARRESLVAGDVLCIQRPSAKFKLNNIQLISGEAVQSPIMGDVDLIQGHRIVEGVELDRRGRQVAYWITQADGTSKRQAAVGRSGRRLAWLLYGTDKRHNAVRGQPLLSLILSSLQEIDRYRDSAQRKAVVNSMLAMFIQKDQDKMSSLPVTGGAVRGSKAVITDDGKVSPRTYNMASQFPGIVFEELQHGEKPVAFQSSTADIDVAAFESAVIRAIAWGIEMPPEILELSFNKSFSASQSATNEFKMYLNMVRGAFGADFNRPIWTDWFISSVLINKIKAPGFLEAWVDPLKRDVFDAWLTGDWSGQIKPSTDIKKQAQGYEIMVDRGWIDNEKASRELTGTKFRRNIKRIKRENELIAEAKEPLAEFDKQFNNSVASGNTAAAIEAVLDRLDDIEENLSNG